MECFESAWALPRGTTKGECEAAAAPREVSLVSQASKQVYRRQVRGGDRYDGHGIKGSREVSAHVSSVRGQPCSLPSTQNRHGSHQAPAGQGPVADSHRSRAGDLARNRVQGRGEHDGQCMRPIDQVPVRARERRHRSRGAPPGGGPFALRAISTRSGRIKPTVSCLTVYPHEPRSRTLWRANHPRRVGRKPGRSTGFQAERADEAEFT